LLVETLLNEDIDLLVNNAGLFACDDITDFNEELWDQVFMVNVKAPVILVSSLRKRFKKGATIINIASIDGRKGSFSSVAYSASKAALINITKSLAVNLGYDERKIRVVGIAPGYVNTNPDMIPETTQLIVPQMTPLGRLGMPEEVADLATFLASEKAKYITGTTIRIDGGLNDVDLILLRESGRDIDTGE
jgi:3-oxoacyl-[acyl-carrier protein] reductase